jgi:mannose-6-phosphate isomerase-like protein (cupin superfamily)
MSGAEERILPAGGGERIPASVGGDVVTIKAGGAGTHGSVAVIEYESAPGGKGPPPHWHEAHEECFYILSGVLSMLVDDEVMLVRPGEFVVAPRLVRHTFWNAGAVPCRFLATFSPAGFEGVFREFARMVDAGADAAELALLPQRYGTQIVRWPQGTYPWKGP